VNRLADVAAAASERRKAAEEGLMGAQRQTLELRKQGEQALLQTQQQQFGLSQQRLQSVKAQIEAEKQSRMASTESLGLAHPAQQRAILGVARKIQQGRQLTQREIEFAGSHRDIFGNALQRIGTQRGQGLMNQLRQMPALGLDNRMNALQKEAVKIQQDIAVRLEIDERSLTDQIANKISGPLQQAIAQLQMRFQAEMRDLEQRLGSQRRTLFPSQG
jgi:hypothetical protein